MAFKFEKLDIWKEAVDFAINVYMITGKFPKKEIFGLTSQLNRAAVSVSLNIAEGMGRSSDADLIRFINMAIGSLNEVVTVLYIGLKQLYLKESEFKKLYERCEVLSKRLHSFKKYLKK
ncbi:MAG: four helix bundle protein [Candidatus Omnitrophica bacterium]|nr:four helix bundle protein [Candidatus Omnitrophota bacterium]